MLIAGIDEAGRGPLAGPVFAAAVILPPEYDLPGLSDSKTLSEKHREALYPEIQRQAVSSAVGMSTTAEINTLNIREATKLAMRRALDALSLPPEELWIDGNMLIGADVPEKCFIKGDLLYPCISAASILAKVTRDCHMLKLHEQYPQYGFDRHKGYGTKDHGRALLEHGSCPEHREAFVQTFLSKLSSPLPRPPNIGERGEKQAAEFLRSLSFRIIEMNYHCRYGEIDIVAEDGTYLVFAEVKTRKNRRFASGAEAVTPGKQRRILQTARHYLAACPTHLQPRLDVIEVYTESGEINHIPNAFTE